MIDQTVFSSWMTILEEHYGKNFSPTLAGFYLKQFSAQLTTEQFQSACEQVMMNEKFFPPLQTFIDYGNGKRDELSDRPEYRQFIAPAPEDPEVIKANQIRLAAMVKKVGRVMPDVADKQEVGGVDPNLRSRCDRLSSAILTANHLILRNEAIRKATEFVEAHSGEVELIIAHDGSVHGVRPRLAKVVRHAS